MIEPAETLAHHRPIPAHRRAHVPGLAAQGRAGALRLHELRQPPAFLRRARSTALRRHRAPGSSRDSPACCRSCAAGRSRASPDGRRVRRAERRLLCAVGAARVDHQLFRSERHAVEAAADDRRLVACDHEQGDGQGRGGHARSLRQPLSFSCQCQQHAVQLLDDVVRRDQVHHTGRSILVVHGRSTADLPSRRRAARSYLSTHHWRLRYGPERVGLVAAYSPTTGVPTAVAMCAGPESGVTIAMARSSVARKFEQRVLPNGVLAALGHVAHDRLAHPLLDLAAAAARRRAGRAPLIA